MGRTHLRNNLQLFFSSTWTACIGGLVLYFTELCTVSLCCTSGAPDSLHLSLQKHTYLIQASTSEIETRIAILFYPIGSKNIILLNCCARVGICNGRQNKLLPLSVQFGNTLTFRVLH